MPVMVLSFSSMIDTEDMAACIPKMWPYPRWPADPWAFLSQHRPARTHCIIVPRSLVSIDPRFVSVLEIVQNLNRIGT